MKEHLLNFGVGMLFLVACVIVAFIVVGVMYLLATHVVLDEILVGICLLGLAYSFGRQLRGT